MTVTIYEDFGSGGANLAPNGAGTPTLKDALRQAADDLAALKTRGDTTMQGQVDLIAAQQQVIRLKLDSLIGNYTGHLAAAGVHVDADTVNVVAAPAATDVGADILALVNDAYDMYLAHAAQGAAIHPGGADAVNVVTATYPATTEAEAVALMNDIVAMYELHRANNGGAYHTNPDATNTIVEPAATEWDDLITLANAYKNTTGFNAHVILTAGPVHGATGVADIITAADCGVQKTALELQLNEFKTDVNAHIASLGFHPQAGAANATAAATTEATSVALINGLATTLNTHLASADDHLGADALTAVVAGVATEYEDILAVAAEWLVAFDLHKSRSAVHAKADAGNAETVIGAATDVAALGVGGAVTIGLVKG